MILGEFLSEFDSQLFDILSDSSMDTFFFVCDAKQNVVRWSKGAVLFLGLEDSLMQSAAEKWGDLIHPDDYLIFSRNIFELEHHVTNIHDCEYRIRDAQGEYVWVSCKGKMTYDDAMRPVLFAGFLTRLSMKNLVDPATQLWTIQSFRRDMEQLLQKKLSGAVMLINVRNFKKVNDEFGYTFGDRTLSRIARIILDLRFPNTTVYRMDGASYAVIIVDGTETDMEFLFDQLALHLETLTVENESIRLNIQCGATIFPKDGMGLDRLQNQLFYAVEEAKTSSANKLIFYNEEMHRKRRRMSHLKDAIRKSVRNRCEGFYVVLQPVMDQSGKRCVAAEALLRFKNEEFGVVSPVEFIPIIEQSGDITVVGKWVLNESLRMMSVWKENGLNKQIERIHVNASYLQLVEEDYCRYAISRLKKYNLDPRSLVIELTESCRVDSTKELAKILQIFHDAGICIALDDFGTGYASLSILKDIPTDMVKLDHTMTCGIGNRPKDKQIVEYIISMCEQMNISVCAEGVENEDICQIVKQAGATYLQGYFYDAPIEKEQFERKYLA